MLAAIAYHQPITRDGLKDIFGKEISRDLIGRLHARGLIGTFLSALVVTALLYVPGVLWLTAVTPLDLSGAVARGAVPFLLGDAVKAAVAALIVTGGWSALRNRA